tara:strand:- start:2942 stop:3823 length:882 start_codon:yes stop_codon:yes gene_type:complete
MTSTPPNKIPLAPPDTSVGEEQRRNQWIKSRLAIDTDGAFGPVDINGVSLNSSQGNQSLSKQLSKLMAGNVTMKAQLDGGYNSSVRSHGDTFPVDAILLTGLAGVKSGGYTTYKVKNSWSIDANVVGSCVCVKYPEVVGVDGFATDLKEKLAKASASVTQPGGSAFAQAVSTQNNAIHYTWEVSVDLDKLVKSVCGECASLPGRMEGGGRISGDSSNASHDNYRTYYFPGKLPNRTFFHRDMGFNTAQIQQAIFDSEMANLDAAGGGGGIINQAYDLANFLDAVTCATHCDGL